VRPPSRPIDWGKLHRAAEQRLGMRKWEIARYTLSQLLNALADDEARDPHRGGAPIAAIGEVEAHWRRTMGE
jgi:hypothetical protein